MQKNEILSIIKDNRFLLLKNKQLAFNPFSVLRLNEYEIRHSNMLAWLLDPNGNHGLRDSLLKRMLLDFLEEEKSVTSIITNKVISAEIYREYKITSQKKIDVLIVINNPKIAILIENKVHAKESRNQLKDYYDFVKKKFDKYIIIPIYLTLFGDDPSHDKYFPFSYDKLIDIISAYLSIFCNQIGNDQKRFIEFYLEGLKEIVGMKNENSVAIAKALYSEYKDVIDYIIDVGISNKFMEASRIFINKNELVENSINSSTAFFADSIITNIKNVTIQGWVSDKPISYWFRKAGESKIAFIIEVGPMPDHELRKKLLEELSKENFKYQKNALNKESRYTSPHFSRFLEMA